jgi:tetratricopeptide (TPR) repeat protein
VLTGAGVAYRPLQPTQLQPAPRRIVDLAPARRAQPPPALERRHPQVEPHPRDVATARVAASPVQSPAGELALEAYLAGEYGTAVEGARRLVEVDPGDAASWVLLVRGLSNLGRMDEAGTACATAHDLHRSAPELAYLHGLLLREGGRADEAVSALRAAIYLDRRLVMAHLTLGDVLASQGDMSAAMRAFRNADRLVSSMRREDIVAASDGLRAETLAQIARGRIEYWRGRPHSMVAAHA